MKPSKVASAENRAYSSDLFNRNSRRPFSRSRRAFSFRRRSASSASILAFSSASARRCLASIDAAARDTIASPSWSSTFLLRRSYQRPTTNDQRYPRHSIDIALNPEFLCKVFQTESDLKSPKLFLPDTIPGVVLFARRIRPASLDHQVSAHRPSCLWSRKSKTRKAHSRRRSEARRHDLRRSSRAETGPS